MSRGWVACVPDVLQWRKSDWIFSVYSGRTSVETGNVFPLDRVVFGSCKTQTRSFATSFTGFFANVEETANRLCGTPKSVPDERENDIEKRSGAGGGGVEVGTSGTGVEAGLWRRGGKGQRGEEFWQRPVMATAAGSRRRVVGRFGESPPDDEAPGTIAKMRPAAPGKTLRSSSAKCVGHAHTHTHAQTTRV